MKISIIPHRIYKKAISRAAGIMFCSILTVTTHASPYDESVADLRQRYPWYDNWGEDEQLFSLNPNYKSAKVAMLEKIDRRYRWHEKSFKGFTAINYDGYVRKAGVYRQTGLYDYDYNTYINGSPRRYQIEVLQGFSVALVNVSIDQTLVLGNAITLSGTVAYGNFSNASYAYGAIYFGIITAREFKQFGGGAYALDVSCSSYSLPDYAGRRTRECTTSYLTGSVMPSSGEAHVSTLEFGPRVSVGSKYPNQGLGIGTGKTGYFETPPLEVALRWRHFYLDSLNPNGWYLVETSFQPETQLLSLYGEFSYIITLGVGYSFGLGNAKLYDQAWPERKSVANGLNLRAGLSIVF